MVLEVMIETENYTVPEQADLERWANKYDLTMPVLSDEDGLIWDYASGEGGSIGLPFTVVMDRGVVIDTIQSGANSRRAESLL